MFTTTGPWFLSPLSLRGSLRRLPPTLATGMALVAGCISVASANPSSRSCEVFPAPVPATRPHADSGQGLARPDPGPDVDSLPTRKFGVQRLLFLRIRYPDDRDDPITEAEAVRTLDETHQMFQRISHGRYGLTPTITPVLPLDHPRSDYDSPGGFDRLLTDARAAGVAAGFDYRDFDLEVVRHSGVPSFAGGNARLGVRGAQVQAGGAEILVHEIGHNLGLNHANFWDTSGPGIGAASPPLPSNYASLPDPRSIPVHPDSVIGHDTVTGPGRSLEYGDPWDIMGTGNREFGAGAKLHLGWLLPADVAHAPVGRSEFRIHETTTPDDAAGVVRLVRVDAPVETPAGTRLYTLEVPPPREVPPSPAGIVIRWIDPAAAPSGPLLLDANPGSVLVNADAALLPGRTFSDPAAPVHVTVTGVGTNSAGFRWADVVVVRDRAPANHPPVITLTADTPTVDPLQPVRLSASVVDADGDPVALAWEFGDGEVAHSLGTGPHVLEHAWKQVADVHVRVTATDQRGGIGIADATIRIGRPDTLRVSGRVLDASGQPIVGARVHNGVESQGRPAENLADTRSDSLGRFTLVGLHPGRLAVAAFHPEYRMERLTPIELGDTDRDGLILIGQALPRVEVEAPPRVTEAAGYTNLFVFRRTGPVDRPLTVHYRLSGSATAATDYVRPLLDRVTIPAGAATATLALTILADAVTETPEDLTLTIAYPTRFTSTDADGNVVYTYFPGWEPVLSEGRLTLARTYPDYLPAPTGGATLTLEDEPRSPQILAMTRSGENELQLALTASPDTTLVLESSADLAHWTPILTNSLPASGQITVNVPREPGARHFRTLRR